MTQELLADLRSRINPAYENVRGTESYERKQCADAIEALQSKLDTAIQSSAHWQHQFTEAQAENERLKLTIERNTEHYCAVVADKAALQAERDVLAAKLVTPNMFWNADDAEQMHHSIDEFLNDEICNGVCEVGGEFEIQRAIRLPNIKIRVTAIDDESCEAEYEVIDAAKGGQHEDA